MGSNKLVKVACLVVVMAAATAFLIGPRPDESSREGRASPEAVAASGATTVQLLDPMHDRPFEISTWDPAENTISSLVVLSHGFGGDRIAHDHLAASLVAQGYTVAAPTHPDIAGLESGDPALDPLVLRPRHLRLTIEEMSNRNGEAFSSVTIVGHSMGAYGALVAAGASPSTQGLESHCATNPSDDILCSDNARRRIDMIAKDAAPSRDEETATRIDHLVLLAPGYGPLFSASDLSSISSTVLIVAASDDDELPGKQVSTLASSLPDATLETYTGGHFVFLRPCTETEISNFPSMCSESPGVDRTMVKDDLVDKIESLANGS